MEGLDSARWKLSRAAVHRQQLERDMAAFFRQEPQIVTLNPEEENNPDPQRRLKLRRPLPDEWVLIIGDCLQNMRSALEHAALAVVLANDPTADRQKVQFPIATTEAEWMGTGKLQAQRKRVSQASYAAQRTFRQLQPFVENPAEPQRNALYVLNELARLDRHQTLSVVTTTTSGRSILAAPLVTEGNVIIDDGPGLKLATNENLPDSARTPPNHQGERQIDMYSSRHFSVCFDRKGEAAQGLDVLDVLRIIYEHIAAHVIPDLAQS